MAQALTFARSRWCAIALALLANAALAQPQPQPQPQPINDPTRPPSVMSAPLMAPGAYAATGAERARPQLQSILVSLRPGGRRVAVIDGKIVRQGQRVGDAVLVAIGAGEVVLRRGARTETIKLFRPATRVATVQP